MSVAGLGFRAQCSVASLRAALDAALQAPTPALPRRGREQDLGPAFLPPPPGEGWGGGEQPTTTCIHPRLTALATAADKANHPALLQLAAELQLPIIPIHLSHLANQTATPSTHVPARYGAHSVAEAAALAAAGPGATLASARCVSPDGMATAALAFSQLNYLAPTPIQNERLPETPQNWLCQAASVAPSMSYLFFKQIRGVVGGKRLRWSLGVCKN